VPPAVRAAEQAQQAVRRALADAARRDVPLRMYIDSVRQKIERNATVSEAQLSSQAVHTDPVVSIAIRSDGSVDDVTILRSSGRADIDEIVRRIVRLNARYAAFPPNVAANYDVIELRRIWTFAESCACWRKCAEPKPRFYGRQPAVANYPADQSLPFDVRKSRR
jgi:TonB family protein